MFSEVLTKLILPTSPCFSFYCFFPISVERQELGVAYSAILLTSLDLFVKGCKACEYVFRSSCCGLHHQDNWSPVRGVVITSMSWSIICLPIYDKLLLSNSFYRNDYNFILEGIWCFISISYF